MYEILVYLGNGDSLTFFSGLEPSTKLSFSGQVTRLIAWKSDHLRIKADSTRNWNIYDFEAVMKPTIVCVHVMDKHAIRTNCFFIRLFPSLDIKAATYFDIDLWNGCDLHTRRMPVVGAMPKLAFCSFYFGYFGFYAHRKNISFARRIWEKQTRVNM